MEAHDSLMTPGPDHAATENAGLLIDPSTRVLLALACFGQMFLFTTIQSWQPYVVGFGIYLIMTVILQRDPVYSIFNEPQALQTQN
jgi:hypothetical protein